MIHKLRGGLFQKGLPSAAARHSPRSKICVQIFRSLRRAVRGAAPKPRRLLEKAGENLQSLARVSAAVHRTSKAFCPAFSRKSWRGSPFLKKGSPKALCAFPPTQNLCAKKRMFFSGSRKGSLLKRTAELWGFRLRFAWQKPHISCVRRAVRGSAPKPRRLLNTHRARERRAKTFTPPRSSRRRRNAR